MRKIDSPNDAITRACASTGPAFLSAFRKTAGHKTKIAIARAMNAPIRNAPSERLSIAWKKGFIVFTGTQALDWPGRRRSGDSGASLQSITISRTPNAPLIHERRTACSWLTGVVWNCRRSLHRVDCLPVAEAGPMTIAPSRPTRDGQPAAKRTFRLAENGPPDEKGVTTIGRETPRQAMPGFIDSRTRYAVTFAMVPHARPFGPPFVIPHQRLLPLRV
ncbi:hypothetical protein LMG27174_06855 [Paraburkholderia rhynchosiae]|uniref:Uncharacterized protein n=1 Tax=Paraburkholderia rhynchosiae TaxID=487049 RepID=A0A6J5CRF3_9BURK|nr:hypothetical protein LMG27174_06855 [Paraburkholderia rhynchosiae]